MGIVVAIILLFMALFLFTAVRKKWINNDTLRTLGDVASFVALLAAILLFIVPAPTPIDNNTEPAIVKTQTLISIDNYTSTPTRSQKPSPTSTETALATEPFTVTPSPSHTIVVLTSTFTPSPTFTPTGGGKYQIAFSARLDATSNKEIFLFDMNSPDAQPINITGNFSTDESPSWSPDGQMIAFVSWRDGNSEIYIMKADGSNLVNLTKHPAQDINPSWSPDGTMIAFTRFQGNREIFVMNSDGSNVRQLTHHYAYDFSPTWLIDNQTIVFSSDRDDPNPLCTACNFELYSIDINGDNLSRITNRDGYDSYPAVSPNGELIAFISTFYGSFDIFTIGVDGYNWNRITTNQSPEYAPGWSPDSQYIYYVMNASRIMRVRLDGSDSTTIIAMHEIFDLALRP